MDPVEPLTGVSLGEFLAPVDDRCWREAGGVAERPPGSEAAYERERESGFRLSEWGSRPVEAINWELGSTTSVAYNMYLCRP